MKKFAVIIILCLVSYILTASSIWEGAAAASNGNELPDSGNFILTNAFPVNTVINVTNLENGRTVRAVAVSGHEIPGLLAILSREAAAAIGLPARTIGRIRMSQSDDPVSFLPPAEGLFTSGDPDNDPSAMVAQNRFNPFVGDLATYVDPESIEADHYVYPFADEGNSYAYWLDGHFDFDYHDFEYLDDEAFSYNDIIDDSVFFDDPDHVVSETVPDSAPGSASISDHGSVSEHSPVLEHGSDLELSLIPSSPRPPSDDDVIPEEAYLIPGIPPREPDEPELLAEVQQEIEEELEAEIQPAHVIPESSPFIPPVQTVYPAPVQPEPVPPAPVQQASPHVFSVPVISRLESGQYYLQIAAYSRVEAVELEIAGIDDNLPVAIMPIGSDENTIYRVLIGPMNLGESGAMLHRFRTTHRDAFVRQGS